MSFISCLIDFLNPFLTTGIGSQASQDPKQGTLQSQDSIPLTFLANIGPRLDSEASLSQVLESPFWKTVAREGLGRARTKQGGERGKKGIDRGRQT